MQYKQILNQAEKILKQHKKQVKKPRKMLEKIGAGGNATCYKINKYAVIDSTAYTERMIKELIEKSQGVKANIVPIVAFKKMVGSIYHYLLLQPFCKGEPIYSNSKIEYFSSKTQSDLDAEFKQHLIETERNASLPLSIYEKFITDYLEISKAGIEIDSLNTENFLINENGINFIDLGLPATSKTHNPKQLCYGIIDVFMGYDYEYNFHNKFSKQETKRFNKAKRKILGNLFNSFEKLKIPHPSLNELYRNYTLQPKMQSSEIE